jgi:glycerol uptake facilitator-like aquaporin
MHIKAFAEFLGTALLLISIVGSGIMGETLSQGNDAIALLANAVATGCMLYCIITILGPVSGAHFNPIVSFAFVLRGELTLSTAILFITAQILGGICGVWLTHAMFDQSIFQLSQTDRGGADLWISEVFASTGLLCVIFGGLASNPKAIPALVGLYITGAYWFTSSTSFANPAVSIARSLTNTFAGINPTDVSMFIACQFVGLAIGHVIVRFLFTNRQKA